MLSVGRWNGVVEVWQVQDLVDVELNLHYTRCST
jgi:hypothetical protein